MKRFLSALALLLALTAGAVHALEVQGTVPLSVKGAAKADFDLSGVILKGVSWEKGAVILPVTESKARTYIDVKLLSKPLYRKLEACFKAGCGKPAPGRKVPVVKVDGYKPLKSKTRVANAEVSFDGELVAVVGVMASSREPGTFWVAFPGSVGFSRDSLKATVEKAVKDGWTKRTK